MPKDRKKLSERHLKVIDNYFSVSNFNKTDAIRRAGFKQANNYFAIFARPEVKAEIKRRKAVTRERYDVSYDVLVTELMRVATSTLLDFVEIDEDGMAKIDLGRANADQLRAIGEITIETYIQGKGENAREVKRVRVKPHDKLKAIDSLMRHAGLSKEKSPLDGAGALVDRILAARNRSKPKGE